MLIWLWKMVRPKKFRYWCYIAWLLSFMNWFSMFFSDLLFEKKLHHNHYTWKAFIIHKLILYAYLNFLSENIWIYWLLSLMKIHYAFSDLIFEKKAVSQSLHMEGFIFQKKRFNMPIYMSFLRLSWIGTIKLYWLYELSLITPP